MAYKLAMLLGLTGLLMALMVDQADALCCHGSLSCGWLFSCKWICGDGSRANPFCGNGNSCNFFGCFCNRGCRGHHGRSIEGPDEGSSLLDLMGEENAMTGRGLGDHDTDQERARVVEEARDLLELLGGKQQKIYRAKNARAFHPGGFDANGDGKLSKEESLEALKELGEVDIDSLPDDWFESMDKDGDGYIEPEEYDNDVAEGGPPAE